MLNYSVLFTFLNHICETQKNSPSHAANKEIFVKLAAKFPDLPFGLTYESSIFANMGVDKDENVVFLRRVSVTL